MKPGLLKRWLDALRSGKYAQTRGHLRDKNGFCCLGVLCDVSGVGVWREGYRGEFNLDGGTTSLFMVPQEIRDGLGMTEYQASSLARSNDQDKLNFRQIADIVESMNLSQEAQ